MDLLAISRGCLRKKRAKIEADTDKLGKEDSGTAEQGDAVVEDQGVFHGDAFRTAEGLE